MLCTRGSVSGSRKPASGPAAVRMAARTGTGSCTGVLGFSEWELAGDAVAVGAGAPARLMSSLGASCAGHPARRPDKADGTPGMVPGARQAGRSRDELAMGAGPITFAQGAAARAGRRPLDRRR